MSTTEFTEQQIRQMAYHLWEQAGKPEGSANRFWSEAEAALINEMAGDRSPPAPIPLTIENEAIERAASRRSSRK